MPRIVSLPRAILDFGLYEKESIGAALARFSLLIHTILDLSLSNGVILHLFCLGLDIDADLCLDMTAGGRFTHKPMMEQVKFLENFIAKHASSVIRTKPLQFTKRCFMTLICAKEQARHPSNQLNQGKTPRSSDPCLAQGLPREGSGKAAQ